MITCLSVDTARSKSRIATNQFRAVLSKCGERAVWQFWKEIETTDCNALFYYDDACFRAFELSREMGIPFFAGVRHGQYLTQYDGFKLAVIVAALKQEESSCSE